MWCPLMPLWFSGVAERMSRFTISFRVLGPLVTFRVSPGVHNLTAADVAKAAGKAGSSRISQTHGAMPGLCVRGTMGKGPVVDTWWVGGPQYESWGPALGQQLCPENSRCLDSFPQCQLWAPDARLSEKGALGWRLSRSPLCTRPYHCCSW